MNGEGLLLSLYLSFNVYGHSFPYSRGMQFFCTFVLMMYYGVIGAVMGCMVLYLYNGTRGFVQGSIAKYGFYAFYPVHLLLYIILIVRIFLEFLPTIYLD